MKKLRVRINNKVYELDGGSATTGPNSIGSNEIEDHSVQEEDLDQDIVDKLNVLSDENVISEEELESDWEDALRQAGLNLVGE